MLTACYTLLPAAEEFNSSTFTMASDMTSFTSPTHTGMRRTGSAVFPRAKREIAKPTPTDTGDVAQVILWLAHVHHPRCYLIGKLLSVCGHGREAATAFRSLQLLLHMTAPLWFLAIHVDAFVVC